MPIVFPPLTPSSSSSSFAVVEMDTGKGEMRRRMSSMAEISADVDEYNREHCGGAVREAADGSPMASGDFDSLLRSLQGETFEQARISTIAVAAAHNRFDGKQARRLVEALDLGDGRIEVACIVYERLVNNSKEFNKVLEAFSDQETRNIIKQRVGLK